MTNNDQREGKDFLFKIRILPECRRYSKDKYQGPFFLIPFYIRKCIGNFKEGEKKRTIYARNRSIGSFFTSVTKWTITALRSVCYKQLHFFKIKGLGVRNIRLDGWQ